MILCLCFAGPVAAGTITYSVMVNTSSINGVAGMVDFQFTPGLGAQVAFVNISSFSGGTLNGSPTLSGGASGNLTGTVHIDNSTNFNDYVQGYTFGNSLQFLVFFGGAALTAPDGTSTDQFTLGLYKGSDFTQPQLNDGTQGDFVLAIDVNSDGTTTPRPASSPKGLVTITPVSNVPEPATWAVCGGMLLGLAAWRRRKTN